jgi:opacity protein-like surface antigen
MKKTLFSTLLLITMSESSAYADLYVRGSAGLAMPNDSQYHYSWDTIPIPMVTGQAIVHGVETGSAVFKSGYLVNGAVGYDFGRYRLEGEIGYQNTGVKRFVGTMDSQTDQAVFPPPTPVHQAYNDDVSNKSISQSVLSYMINGYIDIDVRSSAITPYVMGGLGMASVSMHYDTPYGISSGSYKDNVFAWQVGAGISIKTSKKSAIDLGYRYFATNNTHFNDNHYKNPNDTGSVLTAYQSFSSHNIIAGFRYNL